MKKFNVPVQTEREEAEGFENTSPENMANEQEIRRKKEGNAQRINSKPLIVCLKTFSNYSYTTRAD